MRQERLSPSERLVPHHASAGGIGHVTDERKLAGTAAGRCRSGSSMMFVLSRILTGMRAWIEDVVVDSKARGTGGGLYDVRSQSFPKLLYFLISQLIVIQKIFPKNNNKSHFMRPNISVVITV